jgi:glycosyltransferase involved in cell wall biosynthesis
MHIGRPEFVQPWVNNIRMLAVLCGTMTQKPRIISAVISDLVTDQRVHRAALALHEAGYSVLLLGRQRRSSLPMDPRPYPVRRFRLWWEKGPLFYAAFNIRLFLFLLTYRADILLANDLDTLPAAYLAARIRGAKVIYDSHELFCEVPELVHRPRIRKIWKWIERRLLPNIRNAYTVNESIAEIYRKEYGVDFKVVRNVPLTNDANTSVPLTRADLQWPADRRILLFQGTGINIDRGGEEAVRAMRYLDGFLLVFVGGGDVYRRLQDEVQSTGLSDRVRFLPRQLPERLKAITRLADAGLSLDKDTNLNYRYSLPNKLFDYLQAGIPVIATDLPEVRRIVEGYRTGVLVGDLAPEALADTIRRAFADPVQVDRWKENAQLAAAGLNWNQERSRLLEIVAHAH